MSKIPVGSSPEVQQSFREVWEAIDPFLRTNINLSGRRIINAGKARAGSDYITSQQVEEEIGFDAFYQQLKERGLDGFPGRLADPQETVVAEYPDPPPTDHSIGQIYYDPVTEELKIVTASGVITITSGPPLTAETGSGDVARLDGTGTFTGARNINAQWTFQNNVTLSAAIPTLIFSDTTPSADSFSILVNSDTWWVSSTAGGSVFEATASGFTFWKNPTVQATTGAKLTVNSTGTDSSAYLTLKNDAGEYSWMVTELGTSNDRMVFRNEETSTNLAAFTETGTFYPITTGSPSLGGAGNRWNYVYGQAVDLYSSLTTPLLVAGTASTIYAKVQTTAVNGQAVLALQNDARTYSVFIDSADVFNIRDSTAAANRISVSTAGATTIYGNLGISSTVPTITLTDTTAGDDDFTIQVNSDFLFVKSGTTQVFSCDVNGFSIDEDAKIAGSGKTLGFFGATGTTKTTVAGAHGSNGALIALLATLEDYGLIVDGSF